MFRVLLTLTLLFSVQSFASGLSPAEQQCLDRQTALGDRTDIYYEPRYAQDGVTVIGCDPKQNPIAQEERQACTNAVKEYREYQKSDSDFKKACQAVTSRTDSVYCLKAANRCERCVGTAEDAEDYGDCQDGDSDSNSEDDDDGVNGLSEIWKRLRSGQQEPQGTIVDEGQVRRMKNRFNNCPLYSEDEFKEIVDARKNHEEGKKEGRELLEDKMSELRTAQRELNDLQKEQAKIVPEYTEEFNSIVGEENQKLQDQLKQVGDQLVETILNLQTAEMQFVDAKNNIYKLCHDKAEAALERLKTDRNAKILAGKLRSKGGFAGLTAQTSTAERLEQYAISVRDECKKKNNQVVQQIQSAEKVYGQTVTRLNLQLDKLEALQRDITNKLLDATENPEEKKRLEALKKKYEERSEELEKQIAEKMALIENLTIAIQRIQDELRKDEVLYAHFLKQEQMIERSGGGSESSPTRGDFLAAASAYEDALYEAFSSCGCDGTEILSTDKAECINIKRAMDEDFGDGETGSGIRRIRGTQ